MNYRFSFRDDWTKQTSIYRLPMLWPKLSSVIFLRPGSLVDPMMEVTGPLIQLIMKSNVLQRTVSPQAIRLEILAGGLRFGLLRKIVKIIVCFSSTEEYRPGIYLLVTRLLRLWRINRRPFLVKYLKVCYLCCVQYVAGNKYEKQPGDPIVSVDEMGLPRIIPKHLRAEIKLSPLDRPWELIQAILSIFNLYRVILIPGMVKLQTISDPFNGTSEQIDKGLIIQAMERLIGKVPSLKGLEWKVYHSSNAGPNHSIATLSIWADLYAWWQQGRGFWIHIWVISGTYRNRSIFLQFLLWNIVAAVLTAPLWFRRESSKKRFPYRIGRLAEKQEPAGKVRVFAIADYWTQTLCKGLHDGIYKILSKIPIDGTFDQNACVKRAQEIASRNRCAWSFDLSAATDRLPIALQQQVLELITDKTVASSWRSLLTDRDWYLKDTPLRYAVGQPIGALSSWGMLAITHHLIVQISAIQAGIQTRFEDYCVLGDDVVIFDGAVAERYLKIMDILGVTINHSKSVVSTTGWFEFAKRLCHPDIDVSPFGAKALLMGSINPKWISVAVIDAAHKGSIDPTDGISIFGNIVHQKLLKPEQIGLLYEGLFGPTGIASQVPSLTAFADRKLKHLRVLPNSVERAIVDIYLQKVEEKLSAFYIRVIDKEIPDPLLSWGIRTTWLSRRILRGVHPISWWWDLKMQVIREEMFDFKHWHDLQIADFTDARLDFYGLRGQLNSLKRVDTSKYDMEFGKSSIAKLKEIAIEIGVVENLILDEVIAKFSRFPHLVKPLRPDLGYSLPLKTSYQYETQREPVRTGSPRY